MSRLFRFIMLSLIFILALQAKTAVAQQYSCAGLTLIEINAPDDSMVEDICIAAEKASAFLAQYKLQPERLINLQITETAINSQGYLAYGSYDRQNDIIQLMSLPSILRNTDTPQMYDQPFDQEHYHGAIAHELTHAIFHHNSGKLKKQRTNAAQEYLAHATQMGVLSPEKRHRIIKITDVGPWESGDSISDTYMALRPTGFAVKSYLHLTQMTDPQPFIKLLLNNNWFFISVP